MSEHRPTSIVLNFYRTRKTALPTDFTPGELAQLRRWSLFFIELWIQSPRFRRRASRDRIHHALRPYYPDEFLAVQVDPVSVVLWLWKMFGYGTLETTNRARFLTNAGLGGTNFMFELSWTTFLDSIITNDNSELLNPELFLGKDQKMVSEELGVPKRIVKRLFAHYVATGNYRVGMKRVDGKSSPIRALMEVEK